MPGFFLTDRSQIVKCGQDARQHPRRVLGSFGQDAGVDARHARVRDALARLVVLARNDAATVLAHDGCIAAVRNRGAWRRWEAGCEFIAEPQFDTAEDNEAFRSDSASSQRPPKSVLPSTPDEGYR